MTDEKVEYHDPLTILLINYGSHPRGRYIHSHKRKRRRQHVLKRHYITSAVKLSGCYPLAG